MEAPELRDVEGKVGRKTPEGLVRWMREQPRLRGRRHRGSRSLEDKMEALRLELAGLRALDVQILQQLLLVNEGIEAVKWLLEEKGAAMSSRCSSLAGSQYSLAGSQEASRRSSWSSLPEPAEQLDSISIGSFLDTLADDLDEYSLSTSEPLVASTPQRPPLASTPQHPPLASTPQRPPLASTPQRPPLASTPQRPPLASTPQHPPLASTDDFPASAARPAARPALPPGAEEKLLRPGGRAYDAHWRWLQSQDDVTFL